MADMFDDDLKALMGDRYEEEDAPNQMPAMERKPQPMPQTQQKKPAAPAEAFNPFPKPAPNFMDRLTNAAVWCGICGGISTLLWWFQINGLMAMEAAFPCIVVCALLAGFGAGKNLVR